MSVPMAIALSGLPLLGQPVMVKPSEAEKNLVQSTTAVAGVSGGLIGPYSGGARRLYIENLHYNITETDLHQVSIFCLESFHRIFILLKLSELIDWTSVKAGCNVVNLGEIFQHVTTISFVVVFIVS